jgi:hypothetical protein
MQFSSGLLAVGIAALSTSAGLEGLRRFGLSLEGQQLAAAPSPLLTVLGASATLALGSWVCIALLRPGWARVPLILAWSSAAVLLAVLFHLNHAAYAASCRGEAAVQTSLTHRCAELQRRGRL